MESKGITHFTVRPVPGKQVNGGFLVLQLLLIGGCKSQILAKAEDVQKLFRWLKPTARISQIN